MRTRIPAGLLDSGLTALGTFVINLYAINQIGDLDNPEDLGIYGLFMAAYLFVGAVTTQVMFIPAEKVTLELAPADRTGLAGATLLRGTPIAAVSSLLVGTAALFAAWEGAGADTIVPFTITAVLAGIVTPLQDHVRRLLHLAEQSWSAARVSAVQFGSAVASVALLEWTVPNAFWVPFTAILLSRTVSLGAGVIAAARSTREREMPAVDVRRALGYASLFVSGRYLAATGALSTGTNLLVSAIVTALTGFEVLAYAEAARTVAQPVLVVANGLRSVTGPRSMEAARVRDRAAARSVARTFYVLSVALAVAYVLVAGFEWALNPLRVIADKAYVVDGLVVVTIVANLFNGVAFPNRFELIGADRESSLLTAELWANGAQMAAATFMAFVAGTSVVVGAMTRPVAFAALGIVRIALYRRPLDRHYSALEVAR